MNKPCNYAVVTNPYVFIEKHGIDQAKLALELAPLPTMELTDSETKTHYHSHKNDLRLAIRTIESDERPIRLN